MVNLYRHICFVGGSSETQSPLPPNTSGECIVDVSSGSTCKFSLIVGLCYEMPFRSSLHSQFWATLLLDCRTY